MTTYPCLNKLILHIFRNVSIAMVPFICGIPCVQAQNPTINYAIPITSSNPFGGTSKKVVTDAAGNAYITGALQGTTDFDPSASTANLVSAGDVDVFVAKYDPNGNYVWAFRLGNTGADQGISIAVDDSGNVYATGLFTGTMDMNPGAGTNNVSSSSSGTYVAKYNSSGNHIWSFALTGLSPVNVSDLTADKVGNIYITGSYANTVDFDPSASALNLTMGSGSTFDIYMAKYTTTGNVVWAKSIDATNAATANAIAVDNSGNVFLGGTFNGTMDIDPGASVVNLTCSAPANMFIAKYTSAGIYTWSLNVGDATNNEQVLDLATDANGNIIATGTFLGPNPTDFNPAAGIDNHTPFSSSYTDGFIAKYSPGGIFLWANAFGGNHNDFGLGITTDATRNIYITGYFNDTVDFNPSAATNNLVANGIQSDLFIAKYTIAGDHVWSVSANGSSGEDCRAIALNNNGELYITGTFQSSPLDFDPSASTYNLNAPGAGTVFLAKYNYCSPTSAAPVSINQVSCFGGNNGSAQIHPSGTAPYTFVWSPSGGTDSVGVNLTAGTYTCTVASTCGTNAQAVVTITQPPVLSISLINQYHVTCFGLNDGAAEVTASGGTGSLLYLWNPGALTTPVVTGLSSGTYTCTVTDNNLCTATQTVNITQPPAITFTQNVQLCFGDSLVIGSNTYTSSGTYTHVYTAANGCDSTVTTNLTVIPAINNTVNTSGATLTSNQGAATYQWLYCDTTFTPVAGQTNVSFTATTNGFYAVAVTVNGCTDTSACYEVNSVGLEESTQNTYQLFPNPGTGPFTLNMPYKNVQEILVTNSQGQKINARIHEHNTTCIISLDAVPGIYFVTIKTQGVLMTRKLIITQP